MALQNARITSLLRDNAALKTASERAKRELEIVQEQNRSHAERSIARRDIAKAATQQFEEVQTSLDETGRLLEEALAREGTKDAQIRRLEMELGSAGKKLGEVLVKKISRSN